MSTFDYIVVGSGCAAAMAAQTLLEAGKQVVMLDVGETQQDESPIPNQDFLTLRATDPKQYEYLIGKNAEGIVINDGGKGAQITPSRQYMTRNVEEFIPLESKSFTPIESLGYGGLGIGWGTQCWQFTPKEIARAGLDTARMPEAYEVISKRIGISGTADDAAPYTLGSLKNYQQSPAMDSNMQGIYTNYTKRHDYFQQRGMFLGRTPLAVITEDRPGRQKYAYRDMDFYDDNQLSAWRPWITLNELRKDPNFTYIDGFLATSYSDSTAGAEIRGIDTRTKQPAAYSAGKLILACGALGTARLALRSQGSQPDTKLPFLCNPYTYVPSVQPAMFGKPAEPRKIGFGQLSGFLSEEADSDDSSIMTLYSYQSLMLFRVIRNLPFNMADARAIMQYLASGLIVTGIQHSDKTTPDKYLQLAKNSRSLTGDELQASYQLSQDELTGQQQREKKYIKHLRKAGVYGLKKIYPGHGSSVHYAGTLPFSDGEQPLTLSHSGRLNGTQNIYVADSSGFNFLPARGLTFSLLANAHLTAENVLHNAK